MKAPSHGTVAPSNERSGPHPCAVDMKMVREIPPLMEGVGEAKANPVVDEAVTSGEFAPSSIDDAISAVPPECWPILVRAKPNYW